MGCGGGGQSALGNNSGAGAPTSSTGQAEPSVINLAIPPDPLWDWLKDSGLRAEREQSWNVRINENSLFDQFGAFAGGHADVVMINAMDVPEIVQQSGRKAVVIGKNTFDRSFLAVSRHSQARSLSDLGGKRIAVYSPVKSTLLWGIIARNLYDLDFRIGGRDFDLVVVEAASIADEVVRGGVDACICLPDSSASFVASGDLKPLYDGRSAAEIYADEIAGGSTVQLPIADAFVVDQTWFEENQRSVDFLLSLWEKALQEWKINKAQIIADYPHHFSSDTPEEIAWMITYVDEHDWVAPSVYVGNDDAETNSQVFNLARTAGIIDAETGEPVFDLSFANEISLLESILIPGSGEGDTSGDLGRLTDRLSGSGE